MNGSLLLFDPDHEQCIIKNLVSLIKSNLNNKALTYPHFRHGVSTLSPELFTKVDSILAAIEAQVKDLIKEKGTTYDMLTEKFTTLDKKDPKEGKVCWIRIKNPIADASAAAKKDPKKGKKEEEKKSRGRNRGGKKPNNHGINFPRPNPPIPMPHPRHMPPN
jgi:hypothetical protein